MPFFDWAPEYMKMWKFVNIPVFHLIFSKMFMYLWELLSIFMIRYIFHHFHEYFGFRNPKVPSGEPNCVHSIRADFPLYITCIFNLITQYPHNIIILTKIHLENEDNMPCPLIGPQNPKNFTFLRILGPNQRFLSNFSVFDQIFREVILYKI